MGLRVSGLGLYEVVKGGLEITGSGLGGLRLSGLVFGGLKLGILSRGF